MDMLRKMREIELDTDSPMIEVRGHGEVENYPYSRLEDERGSYVREHLVRERSGMLSNIIDSKKEKKKGEGNVIITIPARTDFVSRWINWLYGQPLISSWDEMMHDELLQEFVEMFRLGYYNKDYEYTNLCIDAIRSLFVEGSADLDEPLGQLKPLLDAVKFSDDHETVLDMIAHVVVFGRGADSGQTKVSLKSLADHYPLKDWARLWQRLGVAFATKVAAQASGDLEDIPDFMAEHAYHLCKPAEALCCGRRIKRGRPRKRKAVEEPTEQEDEDEEQEISSM